MSNKPKEEQLWPCSTLLFFVHFFAVVLHDYNVKRQETSWSLVLWRKCSTCSCSLFHCRYFFLWWPLTFLIFLPPLQIYVVLPTKKWLLISRSCSPSLFLPLSSSGLSPIFSFSPSFSFSIFQNLWT